MPHNVTLLIEDAEGREWESRWYCWSEPNRGDWGPGHGPLVGFTELVEIVDPTTGADAPEAFFREIEGNKAYAVSAVHIYLED